MIIPAHSRIFGTVVSNFLGAVTVRLSSDWRAYKKGDTILLFGLHKFPKGAMVGVGYEGIHVVRTLALIGGEK